MSRVDDDIEDKRAAERLYQQQVQEEMLAKKKQADGSEFDRRMRETTAQRAFQTAREGEQAQHHAEEARRDPLPADVLREAKEKAQEARGRETATADARQKGQDAKSGRSQSERQVKESQERRGESASLLEDRRGSGEKDAGQRVERRKEGFRFGEDLNRGRSEAQGQASQAKGSEGHAEGGEGKVDRQGDGQSKGNNTGQGDKGAGGGHPGFRLNPALLAPPPLARPRDDARSERLRQLANEIAQKIVERARVGKNAAGQAEFQLDLRSNVLSGLSIKVSATGGRISALFFGSDPKVLALLRENADGLKQAMQARGLTLVDLRIEARA